MADTKTKWDSIVSGDDLSKVRSLRGKPLDRTFGSLRTTRFT